MPKKREPVDDVLDAIVWMRRKSKTHEAVDEFIDALLTMRRNTKKKVKKVAKRRAGDKTKGKRSKARPARRKQGRDAGG
jgi:spore cortex formation protein SpoVR/YcgB (stage V sporulation)